MYFIDYCDIPHFLSTFQWFLSLENIGICLVIIGKFLVSSLECCELYQHYYSVSVDDGTKFGNPNIAMPYDGEAIETQQ